MKLKTIKWRRKWLSDKSGYWEEAKIGILTLSVSEGMWDISANGLWCIIGSGHCRSIEEGKRKAEAWLKRQINKIVEE